MRFATRAIHAGQPSEPTTGAFTRRFSDDDVRAGGAWGEQGFDYTRTNNPTRERLEGVLAELEGGTHGAVFGSGLAAEHAMLQAYLKPGQEIVVPGRRLRRHVPDAAQGVRPIGCVITQVDFADLRGGRAAMFAATRLVWLESPTNPRLLVYDIASISRRARTPGALVVVDNTFATPYFQRPFELGADLIIHSVTKYLAGHSDLIQGAVIGTRPGGLRAGGVPAERAGRHPEPVRLLADAARTEDAGAAHAAARGERHRDRRGAAAHPRVKRVYFPGLAASRPRHRACGR